MQIGGQLLGDLDRAGGGAVVGRAGQGKWGGSCWGGVVAEEGIKQSRVVGQALCCLYSPTPTPPPSTLGPLI